MAKERRVLRLQQLILEILAETLQREVADPRLRLVTVTRVKLTSDLEHATVYWSCLAKKDEVKKETEEAMTGVLPLLQFRVARELSIRTTPRLEIRFDPSLEQAQRLETIFHKLREERGEDDEDDGEGDVDAPPAPESVEPPSPAS